MSFGTQYKTASYQTDTKNLLGLVQKLKSEFPHLLLLDIFARENYRGHALPEGVSNRPTIDFFLEYRFLDIDSLENINISMGVQNDRYVPSIAGLFVNASWCEREAYEMYGIGLQNETRTNLLTPPVVGERSFPFRRDKFEDVDGPAWGPFQMDKSFFRPRSVEKNAPENFYMGKILGPIIACPNGPVRLLMDIEGESIKKAYLEVGFSHRALEKKLEGKSVNEIPLYLERLSHLAPHYGSYLSAFFFETLFHITIPERAQGIRMAILEMSRIMSHCVALENLFYTYDQHLPLTVMKWARAKCCELFLELSEGNYFGDLIIVGGLKRDIPRTFPIKCLAFVHELNNHIVSVASYLHHNQAWLAHTQLVPLDHHLGLRYGVLGPNIRASGINLDFRKRIKPYFYSEIDFDIPLGVTGTTHDRTLIRMEEIKQSLRIISQVLDHVPEGDILSRNLNAEIAQKMAAVFPVDETFIPRHRAMVEGPEGPLMLEIYFQPNRLLITAMSDLKIERFRFLSGGFMAAQCLPNVLSDQPHESALGALYSFNINFAEVDR
ncbi:MAG: NADH-quinone oxidoreductase subunit C [Bdellovibrio sp.]|nr:NADH-quinone oxidoreductase subunit C [Bdellovibrio sp.]